MHHFGNMHVYGHGHMCSVTSLRYLAHTYLKSYMYIGRYNHRFIYIHLYVSCSVRGLVVVVSDQSGTHKKYCK